jgi:hypothetical protein
LATIEEIDSVRLMKLLAQRRKSIGNLPGRSKELKIHQPQSIISSNKLELSKLTMLVTPKEQPL